MRRQTHHLKSMRSILWLNLKSGLLENAFIKSDLLLNI